MYIIENMKEYVTNKFEETQKLGEELASELRGGEVVCLEGELGAGKTTFTQGLLKGLGAEGPYTSPTFLIMKKYQAGISNSNPPAGGQISNKTQNPNDKIKNIYHIDAYRIGEDDMLNLGWEEMIADPKNIIIIEWPERIENILPEKVLRIKFEGLDEERRKITFEK